MTKLTNRQAIVVLDGLWSNPLFGEAHRQAFEIGIKAIKALEQEPCKDAIGRSDMLDAIGHGATYTSEELQRIIKGLPSVNPQNCNNCEVGNQCLYCKHEFEPQERSE